MRSIARNTKEREQPKGPIKSVMNQQKNIWNSIQLFLDKHPLVTLKLFYFFAFSSFSLKVVYMPLYFKQIGLPASYAGVLAGLPPFIRGGGAFFLGIVADKMRKRRTLFLISLVANMVIPLLCLIPRIKYPVCESTFTNGSVADSFEMDLNSINSNESAKTFLPRNIIDIKNASRSDPSKTIWYYLKNNIVTQDQNPAEMKNNHPFYRRVRRSIVSHRVMKKLKSENLGIFELYKRMFGGHPDVEKNKTIEKKSSNKTNKFRRTTPKESQNEILTVFVTLLILLIIGEFLGGPLRNLADLCVLQTMGEDKSNYGDVATWMQVGKIVLAPLILLLIRSYPLHVCNTVKDNYEYSLYPLFAFVAFSTIFGYSVKFQGDYKTGGSEVKNHPDKDKALCDVIFTFKTLTILILSFFAGGLSAVHYTFIFWYLSDLSPNNSAVVIAVVIVLRDIVSSISYKMSGRTLSFLGPINTLHLALLLYIVSFITYGVMKNPWFAILPEILQYIVFPLAYSSFVVYLGNNTPPHLTATVQGIYQLLYYGVGFGCGPILAGVLFDYMGGANTFFVFSLISSALFLFSLARHAITRYCYESDYNDYKPVSNDDHDADSLSDEEN